VGGFVFGALVAKDWSPAVGCETTRSPARLDMSVTRRDRGTRVQGWMGRLLMTNTTAEDRAAPVEPGTQAPDFELLSTPDQKVSLADFRGRPTILAFYPEDWSPVCSDQLTLYQELLPEFQRFDAELLGISVDGIWCHLAFARDRNLHFPLLSDFEPKGRFLGGTARIETPTEPPSVPCS
jgi:peroxiredoxin